MIVNSGKLFHNTTKIAQLIGSMSQIYANVYSYSKIHLLQRIDVRKTELKIEEFWLNKPEF